MKDIYSVILFFNILESLYFELKYKTKINKHNNLENFRSLCQTLNIISIITLRVIGIDFSIFKFCFIIFYNI